MKRRPSRRAETDVVLITAIGVAHTASRGPASSNRVYSKDLLYKIDYQGRICAAGRAASRL